MIVVQVILVLCAGAFIGLLLTTEPSLGDWWRKRRGD